MTDTTKQIQTIEKWLRVFCVPGQVVSIQALYGPRSAKSRCTGDLAEAARIAVELDATQPMGVYFTLNPVRPDLGGTPTFPKDPDIVERHWLPIDVDPRRPSGTSSTRAEMLCAWNVLDRCRGALDSAGLLNPVIAFAGNGWHLCYPVLLANDDQGKTLVKDVLSALADRCGDPVSKEEEGRLRKGEYLDVPKAAIGKECHDAKRIWACYGTMKRKGQSTIDRPHRLASLVSGEQWDRTTAMANVGKLRSLLAAWQFASDTRKGRPQTSESTYASAAIKQELAALAAASVGDRNNQLNRSSFALGQLVASGALLQGEVEVALLNAALSTGLNEAESRTTIRSGMAAGLQQPRDLARISQPAARTASTIVEAEQPLPCAAETKTPVFPLEIFPPMVRRFCTEGARSLCCPVDYLAIPMLCVAASAIGASRALRLTKDWWVMPTLYACVVAPPGSAKSPAASRAIAPIKSQQRLNLLQYRSEMDRWNETEKEHRGDKPVYHRTHATSTTVEKLAAVLQDTSRGLFLHRDELVGWIAGMDQYRDGGKGDDRQFWLSLWDNHDFSIERKCHEDGMPITAARPYVSIFGTIQPDVVRKLSTRDEQDGFIERILFAFPDSARERKWDWNGISDEARKGWESLVHRLYSLSLADTIDEGLLPRFMHFEPGGAAAWEEWYDTHQLLRKDLPQSLHACHAKMETYCARFALLIELLWYASPEMASFAPDGTPGVSGVAVDGAARLTNYFLQMAAKTYSYLEVTGDDRRVGKAVEWIQKNGGSATCRHLYSYRVAGVRGKADAEKLIGLLADRGLGRLTQDKSGNGQVVLHFHLHGNGADSADEKANGADSADKVQTQKSAR